MSDPFDIHTSLAAKLASIVVHADEGTGPNRHAFDLTVLRGLIEDEEVQEWLAELRKMALIPEKR
jgi:hypothetical protein